MAFDKKQYWDNKKNNVGSKRPKAQVTPSGTAELIFDNDRLVTNNRLYRRRRFVNRLFTRKGYIDHLHAIRIVRKKHNKTTIKYVKVNESIL